jgi:phosphoglycerol transferase MdoB-like AlkP superfamily enzyme
MKTLLSKLFPRSLWQRRFVVAWFGAFVTVLLFDVIWCSLTTFRGLGFVSTYVNAFLLSLLLAMPTVFSKRRWLQLLVLLVFSIFAICNFIYCRTYFNAIPLASYGLVGNVMDFTASVKDSLSLVDVVLPIVAIITFINLPKQPSFSVRARLSYVYTVVITFVISAICAFCSGGFTKHVTWLKDQCYYATTPAVIYTPFGNLIAEALTSDAPISNAQKQDVSRWFEDHDNMAAPDSLAETSSKDNLVFIFCESLESWPINAKVEGKEITPNLNAFIADSTTYYASRVLSQVGNGRSIDGQLLMLTGMYPMQNFVYAMKYADNKYFALPDAMKQTGAHTYLLSGDKPSTWNQGLIARAFGIDTLLMRDSWDNSEMIGNPKRLSDASLFKQAENKMRAGEIWKEGEKAYVQMVTYTCHNPFVIPDEYKTLRLKGTYNTRLANYITAVHYTDHALGKFINYLRSRSDWNRTMVVIVGDHEALASWRDEICADSKIGNIVSKHSHIPFIVLNASVAGKRESVMGQADVFATVLDQFGLNYNWRGMGYSAIAKNSPKYAFDYQGKLEGDTVGADRKQLHNVDTARKISDLVIRYNLLK